ncbi:Epsin-3, clathrin recruitment and traffic between the Golgi and endosome [Phlyctochytrium bullatum]|nr:Epsin-3, clathrin recruitment and traffic between the Golgi and endosome [Phlyctochytrium bullatum]
MKTLVSSNGKEEKIVITYSYWDGSGHRKQVEHYTFYDFIVNQTRGKSGPLFAFDVFDDVRLTNDASIETEEALQLLEYLIKNGSERVIDNAREHIYELKALRNFNYVDEKQKDQGINVKQRAKEIIELLGDNNKIKEERRKAKENRAKYTGVSSSSSTGFSSGSRYGGFGSETYSEVLRVIFAKMQTLLIVMNTSSHSRKDRSELKKEWSDFSSAPAQSKAPATSSAQQDNFADFSDFQSAPSVSINSGSFDAFSSAPASLPSAPPSVTPSVSKGNGEFADFTLLAASAPGPSTSSPVTNVPGGQGALDQIEKIEEKVKTTKQEDLQRIWKDSQEAVQNKVLKVKGAFEAGFERASSWKRGIEVAVAESGNILRTFTQDLQNRAFGVSESINAQVTKIQSSIIEFRNSPKAKEDVKDEKKEDVKQTDAKQEPMKNAIKQETVKLDPAGKDVPKAGPVNPVKDQKDSALSTNQQVTASVTPSESKRTKPEINQSITPGDAPSKPIIAESKAPTSPVSVVPQKVQPTETSPLEKSQKLGDGSSPSVPKLPASADTKQAPKAPDFSVANNNLKKDFLSVLEVIPVDNLSAETKVELVQAINLLKGSQEGSLDADAMLSILRKAFAETESSSKKHKEASLKAHVELDRLNDVLNETIRSEAEKLSQLELSIRESLKDEYEKQLQAASNEFNSSLAELISRVEREKLEEIEVITDRLHRKWDTQMKAAVDAERDGRLSRLDHLGAKLKYLQNLSLHASEFLADSRRVIYLQTALGLLNTKLTSSYRTPFNRELEIVKKLAHEDNFVLSIVNSIPSELVDDGVTPEAELIKSFSSLSSRIRGVQLMPEKGGPISYMAFRMLDDAGLEEQREIELVNSNVLRALSPDHESDDESNLPPFEMRIGPGGVLYARLSGQPKFSDGDAANHPAETDGLRPYDDSKKEFLDLWLVKLGLKSTGFPSGYKLFFPTTDDVSDACSTGLLYGHPRNVDSDQADMPAILGLRPATDADASTSYLLEDNPHNGGIDSMSESFDDLDDDSYVEDEDELSEKDVQSDSTSDEDEESVYDLNNSNGLTRKRESLLKTIHLFWQTFFLVLAKLGGIRRRIFPAKAY